MKCGEFRAKATHKITIQSFSKAADVYGGSAATPTTQSTPWAAMEPVSGRELYAQDMSQSRVTHKFTIRYQSALKNTAVASEYRISYDGRIFAIQHIRNVDDSMKLEGKSYQVIYAEENGAEL
jgi:SPP1 family predicted phage head-tail adaptor